MRIGKCLAGLVALSMVTVGQRSEAAIYDAANDFSAFSNPGGFWSYGHSPSVSSGFVHYPYAINQNGIDSWQMTPTMSCPFVYHNGTGSPIVDPEVSSIVYQPGQLAFHPGPGPTPPQGASPRDDTHDEYSIIRFTAPSTGAYALTGSFTSLNVGSKEVYVLVNGTAILDEILYGWSGCGYSKSLALSIGDHVDFAVGFPAGTVYYSDTTGVEATLEGPDPSPVPEPTTLIVWSGLGVVGLVAAWRRRRQNAA